jgi:hypothetical protein
VVTSQPFGVEERRAIMRERKRKYRLLLEGGGNQKARG